MSEECYEYNYHCSHMRECYNCSQVEYCLEEEKKNDNESCSNSRPEW